MPCRSTAKISGACISVQVIECVRKQTARRGRAIGAWFVETVAEQVRHADFCWNPNSCVGRFEPESASLGVAEQMA